MEENNNAFTILSIIIIIGTWGFFKHRGKLNIHKETIYKNWKMVVKKMNECENNQISEPKIAEPLDESDNWCLIDDKLK